ncbi:hypothetical protein GCM10025787_02560 [Saccharopolyspora rosea]
MRSGSSKRTIRPSGSASGARQDTHSIQSGSPGVGRFNRPSPAGSKYGFGMNRSSSDNGWAPSTNRSCTPPGKTTSRSSGPATAGPSVAFTSTPPGARITKRKPTARSSLSVALPCLGNTADRLAPTYIECSPSLAYQARSTLAPGLPSTSSSVRGR